MTAVSLATAHHEGAGVPRDDMTAPATKGYSLGIGLTRWQLFRPPSASFATLNFNHVSLDVLFSGDRDVYPITSNDLRLLAEVRNVVGAMGWIIDAPYVRPHRQSPGSDTICPGNKAAPPDPPNFPVGDPFAWLGIVTALHRQAPPAPPQLSPQFFPALEIVSWSAFHHPTYPGAVVGIDHTGAAFCLPAGAYCGGTNGQAYFAGRTAARVTPNSPTGYTITDTAEEPYHFPVPPGH